MPMSAFLDALIVPHPRVFEVGANALETRHLRERGCTIESFDTNERDLRLLTLEKESFDAIWCHRLLTLTMDEYHRILGSFFRGLKPGKGILLISFQESRHPEHAFQALLRQSGFHTLSTGRNSADRWLAVIAKRV